MENSHPCIFQSFDALVGLRELLKEQERIKCERKILSEDDLEILNRKIYGIKEGMIVSIIYFESGEYIKITGKVAKINLNNKFLQIVKKNINIRNIVEIEYDEYIE